MAVIVIGIITILWFLFGKISIKRKEIYSNVVDSSAFEYSNEYCEMTVGEKILIKLKKKKIFFEIINKNNNYKYINTL